jgi:hypothetical protein
VHVNFERYNNWNPEYAEDYRGVDSGGNAAAMAVEVMNRGDGKWGTLHFYIDVVMKYL